MICIDNKKECCGCGACAQICPKNCITMRADDEGFIYPDVDKSLCIDCHLCEKRCPIQSRTNISEEYKNSFLGINKSETRLNSSSGGIFILLVNKIMSEGGVVFGAAYDEHFLVQHIVVESPDQLHLLMGSKYLQSSTGDSFQKAKNYLQDGRKVLFSGTACQIAGLKSFLGKEYDNLWTVDVLCHGAPSPEVWRRYLDDLTLKYKASIESVNFRNKNNGWHNYTFIVNFTNKKSYEEPFAKNTYMKMFLRNFILRPSCYSCHFKNMKRCSDVTLGDAWNVENIMPQMDDDFGTSIIVTHTDKGNDIIESIKECMRIEPIELDKILPVTADSRKSVSMPGARRLFFFYFRRGADINKLLKCVNGGRKIAILSKIIRNK